MRDGPRLKGKYRPFDFCQVFHKFRKEGKESIKARRNKKNMQIHMCPECFVIDKHYAEQTYIRGWRNITLICNMCCENYKSWYVYSEIYGGGLNNFHKLMCYDCHYHSEIIEGIIYI